MEIKRATLVSIIRDTDRRLQLAACNAVNPQCCPKSVVFSLVQVQDALTAATNQARRLK